MNNEDRIHKILGSLASGLDQLRKEQMVVTSTVVALLTHAGVATIEDFEEMRKLVEPKVTEEWNAKVDAQVDAQLAELVAEYPEDAEFITAELNKYRADSKGETTNE